MDNVIISKRKTQERISLIIFQSSLCVKGWKNCGLSHSLFKFHVASVLHSLIELLSQCSFHGMHFNWIWRTSLFKHSWLVSEFFPVISGLIFCLFFKEKVQWAHLSSTMHCLSALDFLYDRERSSNNCLTLIYEKGKVPPPPVLETRVSCHLKTQKFCTTGGQAEPRQMLNKLFPLLQHIILWIQLRMHLFLTLVSSSSLFLARIISSKSFLLRFSSSIKARCCNNTIPEVIRVPL